MTDMISFETKVTLVAIVVAIVAWLASVQVTESVVVQGGVLLGIGVVAPSLYLLARERRSPA